MPGVAVVTDSTAYLPEGAAEEYGIVVVPLSVAFNGTTYREGVDIDDERFFALMAGNGGFPTTSQPPVGAFEEAYRRLLEDHDEIVSIHLSGDISGTVHTARTAAELLGADGAGIQVVDSRRAAIGLFPVVLEVAELARSGADGLTCVRRAEEIVEGLDTVFYVDTLAYLHRGGRLSTAQAFMGETLRVKPLLTIDGEIRPVAKVRTRRRAIDRMLEIMSDAAHEHAAVRVAVTHVSAPEAARELADQVAERVTVEGTPTVSAFGPVIGAHLGPGALGVAWWPVETPGT